MDQVWQELWAVVGGGESWNELLLSLSSNQFLTHDHGHGDTTYSTMWKCCRAKKQPTDLNDVIHDSKIVSWLFGNYHLVMLHILV